MRGMHRVEMERGATVPTIHSQSFPDELMRVGIGCDGRVTGLSVKKARQQAFHHIFRRRM